MHSRFSHQISVCIILILLHVLESSAVHLKDNAYRDISIRFSPLLSQKDVDLSKLKSILEKASSHLLRATRRRSYFSDFVVTIPRHWDESLCEDYVSKESLASISASIYFQPTTPARTQHGRNCGKSGEIIFLPIQWLDKDQDEEQLARELVRQWAIYRYGVFEETPVRQGSCFASDSSRWSPSGCYNADVNVSLDFDADGLPVCDFESGYNPILEMSSSVMYNSEITNMTDFCDGTKSFPHSPLAETRHNILCDRKSVWNVIENNIDFKYGINPPIEDVSFVPKVSLKCLRDQLASLHFLIQNASTVDVTAMIAEVRYAILRFFTYSLYPSTNVSITTFSDENKTMSGTPTFLDLTDRMRTRSQLKENIRVNSPVSDICFVCGLKKVDEVTSGNSHAVIVAIFLASTLTKTSYSELLLQLEAIQTKLFLLIIEDEQIPAPPSDVIKIIYGKGGGLYHLSANAPLLNTEINLALINILNSYVQYENEVIIVHQSTFTNVASDLKDAFYVDEELQGDLTYTLKCNNNDMIDFKNSACSDLEDLKDSGFTCGLVSSIKPGNVTEHQWDLSFKYLGGIQSLVCSSLATVRLLETQRSQISLGGTLSRREMQPGENSMIIYAELLKNFETVRAAVVQATVQSLGAATVIELRDNGNGDPDTKAGDGIYSRYFTSFLSKGIYSVFIRTSLPISTTDDRKDMWIHSRFISIGVFVVLTDPPKMDIYPPNRIADLAVAAIDHDNQIVTLTWTAPGGDYDLGQAAEYVLKYSTSWISLTNAGFDAFAMNLRSMKDQVKPSMGGTHEKEKFKFTSMQKDEWYFAAIKSMDEHGRLSEISNIVQIFIPAENSIIPTTQTTVTATSNIPSSDVELDTISTEISSMDSTMSHSTIDASTLSASFNTSENYTSTITDESTTNMIETPCTDSTDLIILISSIVGGCLILIIIGNIIFCCCLLKLKKNPKQLTKRQSMLPPHNLTVAYQPSSAVSPVESATEDEGDPEVRNQYTLVTDPNSTTLANNKSITLRARTDNEYEDYRAGYQLASAIPAYVTEIGSRGVDEVSLDNDQDVNVFMLHDRQISDSVIDDAQIYNLGTV